MHHNQKHSELACHDHLQVLFLKWFEFFVLLLAQLNLLFYYFSFFFKFYECINEEKLWSVTSLGWEGAAQEIIEKSSGSSLKLYPSNSLSLNTTLFGE